MPVRSRLVARFAPSPDGAPCAVRADVAATTPLELRGPFPASIPGTPPRYLLRNVTVGILDGDDYAIEVCAAPGTRVAVEPTSAAKVFRSRGGGATLRTRIEVMPGAELRYDSGLLIPHAGAVLRQQTEIVLHESARASWSESLSFGRLSHDERFQFTRIESELRVVDPAGRVRYERCSDLVPQRDRAALESAVGRFGAVGSMVLLGGPPGEEPELPDLSALPGVYAGATTRHDRPCEWPEQIEARARRAARRCDRCACAATPDPSPGRQGLSPRPGLHVCERIHRSKLEGAAPTSSRSATVPPSSRGQPTRPLRRGRLDGPAGAGRPALASSPSSP